MARPPSATVPLESIEPAHGRPHPRDLLPPRLHRSAGAARPHRRRPDEGLPPRLGPRRAGRRVRQETSLGAAPDAFVALGTDVARDALGGLAGRDAVVIGAGQMASLAVTHLRREGIGPVRILNRSLEYARTLAERTDAEHGDLNALPD